MLFKAILLLAVIATVAAQVRVNLRACPGGHPMPDWFESTDCTATLCTLRRHQTFAGRAQWTTARAFSILDITVEATAFGQPIAMPLPVGYTSACGFLEGGASCPIAAGSTNIWGLRFPIEDELPALASIAIRIWAGDAAGRSLCAEVDGEIV